LARATFQIRGEEQVPLGPPQEIGGEAAHALRVTTKDDEAAHAEFEGVGDGAGFVGERSAGPGAERREN
jgi:hypothetical protein